MRWTAKKVGLHKKPTITDTRAYSEFFQGPRMQPALGASLVEKSKTEGT